MSNLLIYGFVGTFGAAMALFVLTSAVAVPFVLFAEIRGHRRR
jgi:hypothetical protein